MSFDHVAVLRRQSEDIAAKGIPGWGNTMLFAAEEIERLRGRVADLEYKLEEADRCAEYHLKKIIETI